MFYSDYFPTKHIPKVVLWAQVVNSEHIQKMPRMPSESLMYTLSIYVR